MKKTVAIAAILLASGFTVTAASGSSSTAYVNVGFWSGSPDLDQSILNDVDRPSQADDPPGNSDSPSRGFWSGHPDLGMSILNDVGRPSPKGSLGNSGRRGYWSGHPDLGQSILNGV